MIPSNSEVKMKNEDDRSYERYKQYRLNKYRYEQDQKIFPVAIIIALAIIIGLLKYILIAIAIICVLAIVLLFVYLYLKKQLTTEEVIVLSKEDAKEGVDIIAYVMYESKTARVETVTPKNAKDGQKFVVKNVLFENKKGKKIRKNVHFKIQVL